MIEINITDTVIERAKKLYDFHRIKNSITKGKSENYGALGEAIIMDYYGLPEEAYSPTKDYDILFNGKTVDVKTKKATAKPRPHYFASVTCKSYDHQKCDYYCFVRINTEMTLAWICGFLKKSQMVQQGQKYLKGQPDPTSQNGFSFKEDCWNIELSKLNLSKSDILNEHYLRMLGFKIQSQQNSITITEYKACTINGFDHKIRILLNNNISQCVVQKYRDITIFEGFLNKQTELQILFGFLKILL